jgi:hypothetical protein
MDPSNNSPIPVVTNTTTTSTTRLDDKDNNNNAEITKKMKRNSTTGTAIVDSTIELIVDGRKTYEFTRKLHRAVIIMWIILGLVHYHSSFSR